ncbi:MAG TPA: carboxypeptidase-like regulatory domain-containing protein, partial [Gemmatimonadaceae bacterium]
MSIATPRPPRPAAARRRGHLALPVALLVAPLLLAPPLQAQEPAPDSAASVAARTVTLAGVVRDTAGHPLSGAEVRADATQFTLTGADGGFLLTGVAPDTIQLL